MKKILVGYIMDGKHSGIDKYLLNFCSVAAEHHVTLDFLTDKITPDLQNYLQGLHFGLFEIPSLKHPVKQYRVIRQIIQHNGYDGVYFNISEAFHCLGLLAACRQKVPVRIVHSHSSGVDRNNPYVRAFRTFLHKVCRLFYKRLATRHLACSQVAGYWMYPKKVITSNTFQIIYNAVDGRKFAYDAQAREEMRSRLSIPAGWTVLIHIGHFCYAKNNFFLMDVVRKTVERDKNVLLLSCGTGVDFDAVKAYAQQIGIADHVRFLGVRTDVPELLSAADIFVFPSRFEGLSVTCIEAQFSGLPCIFSEAISPETQIAENVTFLPAHNPSLWAETIVGQSLNRQPARLSEESRRHYDLVNQRAQLADILED